MAILQWVPRQIEDITDPQAEEEADIEVEEVTTYALLLGVYVKELLINTFFIALSSWYYSVNSCEGNIFQEETILKLYHQSKFECLQFSVKSRKIYYSIYCYKYVCIATNFQYSRWRIQCGRKL